jgi:hypothetical protein
MAPEGHEPARLENVVAGRLRVHMVLLDEVVLVWPDGRVRGYVDYVAMSDAFCLVWNGEDFIHVPLGLLPTVRKPHFHEDGQEPKVALPPRRVRVPVQLEGQLELWVERGTP